MIRIVSVLFIWAMLERRLRRIKTVYFQNGIKKLESKIYPSRLELRCGSKRLGRGSVMTAAAVLGTLRFAQPTDGTTCRLGKAQRAQHGGGRHHRTTTQKF